MPIKRCLYCLEEIDKETLSSYLLKEDCLCYKCRFALRGSLRKTVIRGIEINYLYLYDDFFKGMILQYKEANDEVLAQAFLGFYEYYLKIRYYNYHLVFMPSSKAKLKSRGFNHLTTIFSSFSQQQKRIGFKRERCQEGLNLVEREKMLTNFYAIDKFVKKEKILLIDDICTTGSSLKGAYNLLKSFNCHIKVFVLAIVQQKQKRKGFHFWEGGL